jgi:uncharacterized integral membrane protein
VTTEQEKQGGISAKGIIGLIIALVTVLLIAFNRDQTSFSYIFGTITTPLWVVLTIFAVLGFLIGWMVGRRRRS